MKVLLFIKTPLLKLCMKSEEYYLFLSYLTRSFQIHYLVQENIQVLIKKLLPLLLTTRKQWSYKYRKKVVLLILQIKEQNLVAPKKENPSKNKILIQHTYIHIVHCFLVCNVVIPLKILESYSYVYIFQRRKIFAQKVQS